MRILHLTDRWTDRGGAYVHLQGVVAALGERGHAQTVAAEAFEAPPSPFAVARPIPGLGSRLRVATSLDMVEREPVPDVVHVHTCSNPDVLEWAAARGAVMTVQDHRAFCPGRGKWAAEDEVCRTAMSPAACARCLPDEAYAREMESLVTERLAAVSRMRLVTLSRYMRSELVGVGVDAARISVVPPFVHGLSTGSADEVPGDPCVAFVGRLVEAKGVRDAVLAWRASGVSQPLVFFGTGPLREWLVGEGFVVTGWLGRDALARALRGACALLMPSRWQEPFGLAGLEALSLRIPVVAWDSGGVREWHSGDGLVPWGDVEGLARELLRTIGRRATPPGGFERDALMERLEAVYRTTLLANGRHVASDRVGSRNR